MLLKNKENYKNYERFIFTRKHIPENKSVSALLYDFEKKYSNIFKKVKKDWNNSIREFLRDSTGLKLRTKNTFDISVEIIIKSDRNDKFIKLIDENFPELNFFEYKQLKEFLETALKTKDFLTKDVNISNQINGLIEYSQEYFKKYDLKNIVSKLFASNAEGKDIWGVSFQNLLYQKG